MAEQDADELAAVGIFAAYARHRPDLVQFLARRLRDAASAEDLVQDLWLRLGRVTAPVRNPRAFLFQAAANLAANHGKLESRRAALRREAHDLLWGEIEQATPERHILASDELRRIVALLPTLSARTREILILSRFDGLNARQIGERTGISGAAVEKHLHKAMRLFLAATRDGDENRNASVGNLPRGLS